MVRILGALILVLAAAAVVQAHALYLVPDAGDATKVLVVFADALAPDANIKDATWKRFEGIKLSARDEAGKATPVKFTKQKDHLLVAVPAGTRVIVGEVDGGAVAKGSGQPKLVKMHTKAIIGAIPKDGGKLGDDAEMDIVPNADGDKIRFQVLAHGKPLANATVAVMVPGKKGEVEEKTDDKGWTKAIDGTGKFGVTCRHTEMKSGERDGKKYDGISHTATLVVDVK